MNYRVKDDTYGIAELQTKMLEILKEFIRVCEKCNLTYYACGGTCIGALRHDGFIPWDDDLDIFMPRSDYEKLWLMRDQFQKGKYKLCRTTKERNYHHRVQQLVDLNTTFINQRSVDEDIEHGVYIDILPIDACAPTGFGRFRQRLMAMFFSVYNVQCLPEFHGGNIFRFSVWLALHIVPSKNMRYQIWHYCEKKMTQYDWTAAEYVVDLSSSVQALFNPFPKAWFEKGKKHQFEDIQINLPAGVTQYLTQVYGNYMSLPPEDKRHPVHNTVKIDLYNSYKIYRGKLYFTKN